MADLQWDMENGRWRRGADSKMLRYIPHTSTSKKNGKVYHRSLKLDEDLSFFVFCWPIMYCGRLIHGPTN